MYQNSSTGRKQVCMSYVSIYLCIYASIYVSMSVCLYVCMCVMYVPYRFPSPRGISGTRKSPAFFQPEILPVKALIGLVFQALAPQHADPALQRVLVRHGIHGQHQATLDADVHQQQAEGQHHLGKHGKTMGKHGKNMRKTMGCSMIRLSFRVIGGKTMDSPAQLCPCFKLIVGWTNLDHHQTVIHPLIIPLTRINKQALSFAH